MFAVGVKRDFHIKFIFNKSLYIAGIVLYIDIP